MLLSNVTKYMDPLMGMDCFRVKFEDPFTHVGMTCLVFDDYVAEETGYGSFTVKEMMWSKGC